MSSHKKYFAIFLTIFLSLSLVPVSSLTLPSSAKDSTLITSGDSELPPNLNTANSKNHQVSSMDTEDRDIEIQSSDNSEEIAPPSKRDINPSAYDKAKRLFVQSFLEEPKTITTQSYVEASPITISSDSDFISAGFAGSGTVQDPYILENQNITTMGQPSISITNTDAHFIIRNSLFSSGTSGIYHNNVTNGVLENNIIRNTTQQGLYLYDTYNTSVISNQIANNTGDGLYLESLFDIDDTRALNNISFNIFHNNSQNGLNLTHTQNNTISFNQISNNSLDGIYFDDVMNGYNKFFNNTIFNNTNNAINVFEANKNDFYNNTILENAFYLDAGDNNQIIHNNIFGTKIEGRNDHYPVLNNSLQFSEIRIIGEYDWQYETFDFTTAQINYNYLNHSEIYVLDSLSTEVYGNSIYHSTSEGIHLLISSPDTGSGITDVKFNRIVNSSRSGILISYINDITVENNSISLSGYHGLIVAGPNAIIKYNIINDNSKYGLLIYESYITIISNTLSNNRFGSRINSAANTIEYNEFENGVYLTKQQSSMANNTVSGLPLVYLTNETNQTIEGDIGQVILYRSNYTTIKDGISKSIILIESHENTVSNKEISGTSTAISLITSHNNSLTSNYINNSESGIHLIDSDNNQLENNIIGNTTNNGIEAIRSYHMLIKSNTIQKNIKNGIYIKTSSMTDILNVSILDNVIKHNFENGIKIEYSDNITISNNDISNNSMNGILTIVSDSLTIDDNNVTNNSKNGIFLDRSEQVSIYNNLIQNNTQFGIELTGTDYEISYNSISNNTQGIHMDGDWTLVSNSLIFRNDIANNSDIGIYTIDAHTNSIYRNQFDSNQNYSIFLNYDEYSSLETFSSNYFTITENNFINNNPTGTSQVYDNASNIDNDFNSNHYSEWTSPDGEADGIVDNPYDVDGGTNQDSQPLVNQYDVFSPELVEADDISYEFGTTGNIITWQVTDDNPGIYNGSIGGSDIADTTWSGSSISVNVDGLDVGVHLVEINVYDLNENPSTDELQVTVYASTPPETSSPSDIFYLLDSTTNSIQWLVSDQSPDYYNVTIDGSEFVPNTSWSNGTINLSIDGLSEGTHSVIITLVDEVGNVNTDEVIVSVDGSAPVISGPEDVIYRYESTGNQLVWDLNDLSPDYYNISIDNTIVKDFETWQNGSVVLNIDNLSVGTHTIKLIAVDRFGVISTDTVLVIVDGIDPTITTSEMEISIYEGEVGNSLQWNVADDHLDSYEIITNSSLSVSITSFATNEETVSLDIDELAFGTYNFTIIVYDQVGNTNKNTILVYVGDNQGPSFSLVLPTSSYTSNSSVTYIVDVEDPRLDQVWFYDKKSGNNLTLSPESGNRYQFVVDLSQGNHQIKIYANDTSGNINNTTYNLLIDTDLPTLEVLSPASQFINASTVVKLRIEDNNNIETISYRWGTDSILDLNVSTSSEYLIPLPTILEENIFLTIEVIDTAGNRLSETLQFIVDEEAPDLSEDKILEDNPDIKAGGTMTVKIEDTNEVVRLEYRWDNGQTATADPLNSSTLTLSQVRTWFFSVAVPENLDGSHELTLIAYDSANNAREITFTVTVSPPDVEPIELDTEVIILAILAFVIISIMVFVVYSFITSILRKRKVKEIQDRAMQIEGWEPDVFISYSTSDQKLANSLYMRLNNEGIEPWIATEKINVGDSYNRAIIEAIDTAKYFIILISQNSILSRHVLAELERAFTQNLTIIPIKLDNVEIPSDWEYFLSTSQWIEASKISETEWITHSIDKIRKEMNN